MELIYLLLAVVCVLLLLTLLFHIDFINKMTAARKIAAHEKHQISFADHLVYAAEIEDGIIVCKNGALMASWVYTCPDTANQSETETDVMIQRLNQAVKSLGTGWMLNFDCIRDSTASYIPRGASAFTSEVAAAIDEERRRLFQDGDVYDSANVLTLTWLPPAAKVQKLSDMIYDDDERDQGKDRTAAVLKQFKSEIQAFEQKMSICCQLDRLHCFRQTDDAGVEHWYDSFLSFLNCCITGSRATLQLPEVAMYLDQVIGSHEFWATTTPQIDDIHVSVIAIDGFPEQSYAGMLNILAQLTCRYRWSTRYVPMDAYEAENMLAKMRRLWQQKTRGLLQQMFNIGNDHRKLDAVRQVDDVDDTTAEISSNAASLGFYTSNIILYDNDLTYLENVGAELKKDILRLGFSCRTETVNAPQAFLGSLPGMRNNIRHPLMTSQNLSDLLPTISVWTGEDKCPCGMYPAGSPCLMYCLTSGSTPFRLNLHVRDLGHTFIFGPTGSGKSTLLATLAAQFQRYHGMHVYCFDKGYSMYPLTLAVGGAHFDVAGDESELAFCPLQFIDNDQDRAWSIDWIIDILALNGVEVTPAQRNLITDAIVTMASTGACTMSDFVTTVQDNAIRDALAAYVVGGQMGKLFDADHDALSLSAFTTFELEDLMNLPDRFRMPVLLYLFRRIEKNLKGEPSVIMLDEAWIMLANPVFRGKIREWLKVLRKSNCAVVMATQSLSDAANSGILDVITESTATKIFLANPYANDPANLRLYEGMGLNDHQIDIIASMIPKRQYYYFSELGQRLFELALGPLTLAFVGSSDKKSIAKIRQLHEKDPEHWYVTWLQSKNIRLSDYLEERS